MESIIATTNHTANTKFILYQFQASLALHKAEVAALRQAIRQLSAENRKLYSDNKEANRRSALLAQEIDDRHMKGTKPKNLP